MSRIHTILGQHPFFHGFTSGQLAHIMKNVKEETFEAGKFIFHEGEVANNFYIVEQGRVALELFSADRGPVVIETIGQMDVLGWSWLIPPYRWKFDALAQASVTVITLDGERIRNFCEKDKTFGYQLLKRFYELVAERLEATRIRLLDLYGHPKGEEKSAQQPK